MGTSICLSCRTLAGGVVPTDGIVYDDAHLVVFLRSRPLLTPGQEVIALKRLASSILVSKKGFENRAFLRRSAITLRRNTN